MFFSRSSRKSRTPSRIHKKLTVEELEPRVHPCFWGGTVLTIASGQEEATLQFRDRDGDDVRIRLEGGENDSVEIRDLWGRGINDGDSIGSIKFLESSADTNLTVEVVGGWGNGRSGVVSIRDEGSRTVGSIEIDGAIGWVRLGNITTLRTTDDTWSDIGCITLDGLEDFAGTIEAGNGGSILGFSLLGNADFAGVLTAGGTLGDVRVRGSVTDTASITAGRLGVFSDIRVDGDFAGRLRITAQTGSGSAYGDIRIGEEFSGVIDIDEEFHFFGSLSVGGDMTGILTVGDRLSADVTVGGSLLGGITASSVSHKSRITVAGDMGDLTVTGNLQGRVTIGGDLLGQIVSIDGDIGGGGGRIRIGGDIASTGSIRATGEGHRIHSNAIVVGGRVLGDLTTRLEAHGRRWTSFRYFENGRRAGIAFNPSQRHDEMEGILTVDGSMRSSYDTAMMKVEMLTVLDGNDRIRVWNTDYLFTGNLTVETFGPGESLTFDTLGNFTVLKGDLAGSLTVLGDTTGAVQTLNGDITGRIDIGGDLTGGISASTGVIGSGVLDVDGTILGTVRTRIFDNVLFTWQEGRSAYQNNRILVTGTDGWLTIDGSLGLSPMSGDEALVDVVLDGPATTFTSWNVDYHDLTAESLGIGSINAGGIDTLTLQRVNLGEQVYAMTIGSVGVSEDVSGRIVATGEMGEVTLGGGLMAGGMIYGKNITGDVEMAADLSGTLMATTDILGTVNVGGNIGATGYVQGRDIGGLDVGGGVSGRVVALGTMGPVSVGADLSGLVAATNGFTSSIDITGDVNGQISTYGDVSGPVLIGGDMNGVFYSVGGIRGDLSVGGSVVGQATSGAIDGSVTIQGDLSGTFQSTGALGSDITVGGAVSGHLSGTNFKGNVDIGSLTGSVQSVTDIAGMVTVASDIGPGAYLTANHIGGLTVGGDSLGVVTARQTMGPVGVAGNLGGQMIAYQGFTSGIDLGGDLTGALWAGSGIGGLDVGGAVSSTGVMTVQGDLGGLGIGGGFSGRLTVSGDLTGAMSSAAGDLGGSIHILGDITTDGSIAAPGGVVQGGVLDVDGTILGTVTTAVRDGIAFTWREGATVYGANSVLITGADGVLTIDGTLGLSPTSGDEALVTLQITDPALSLLTQNVDFYDIQAVSIADADIGSGVYNDYIVESFDEGDTLNAAYIGTFRITGGDGLGGVLGDPANGPALQDIRLIETGAGGVTTTGLVLAGHIGGLDVDGDRHVFVSLCGPDRHRREPERPCGGARRGVPWAGDHRGQLERFAPRGRQFCGGDHRHRGSFG